MTLEEKEKIKREILNELLTVRKGPRASTKISQMIDRRLMEAGFDSRERFKTKAYIQGIIKTCLNIRGMAWLQFEDIPKAAEIANKVFEIIEEDRRCVEHS